MPYKTVFKCSYCQKQLSPKQVFYSYGRCPKCGVKGETAGTIVDCYEEAEWVEPINMVDILLNAIFVIVILFLIGSVLFSMFGLM